LDDLEGTLFGQRREGLRVDDFHGFPPRAVVGLGLLFQLERIRTHRVDYTASPRTVSSIQTLPAGLALGLITTMSRFPSIVLAGRLFLLAPMVSRAADWIWVEGESAAQQNVTHNPWYESVPKGAFSGGGFLAHFDDTKPGEASYNFDATSAGDYALWLRANPHETRISFQLNGSSWREIATTNALQQFTLTGWDMRFVGWIEAGTVPLKPGTNEIQFRFEGQPKPHGLLDCFVLTRQPFTPFGIAKPDEAAKLRQQQADDETNWFDFNPPRPERSQASAIDLRFLNEKFAGDDGRIQARDGKFVHAKSGQPVRFWAVNGPPHELKGEALRDCARFLARYGVNLVRVHGAVFDGKTGAFRTDTAQHLVEIVEAMKAEGIYTHLSIYFPLWFKPAADLEWLPGYDGNKNPFATLMFNGAFQQRYEEWWRGISTAKLSNGQPLFSAPALFGVEIQNEDSFFFWTFNEGNIPDPQLRILEKQFGDWLVKQHGSLAKAFEVWGGVRLKRDAESEGRVAFRPLYEMFTKKTPRDRDTAAFLFETQTGFYRRAVQFLRSLGFEGLITPSNWATASPEVFGPLEKLSYTSGDFIDRHGYFGCRNAGLFSEWSIRDGQTYVDRSALRFEAEEPGRPHQFNHPVIDIHYDDKPSMISETTWCRPNRYRTEAPLFFACYGALQDSDAIVHFALDGASWSVKPRFWMQPWTLVAPSQLGQFPAAAVIYRRGLVSPGALLADLTLGIEDLKNLQGTPMPQDAAFDELRLKDVPAGTELKPGNRVDPLIHFAGRAHVTFASAAGSARTQDLSKLVDRAHQTVTSSTGELKLDYGRGVLTINAPATQGVSGNLRAASEVVLSDVRLQCPLDLAHIVIVALDGQPLRTSKRMLLQAMSEEKNSGFRAVPQGAIQLIESIGDDPWRVRKLAGTVRLIRPDAAQLTVTALDLNGVPTKPLGHADAIELAPDRVYYLIGK
jgi:hypothetical protein